MKRLLLYILPCLALPAGLSALEFKNFGILQLGTGFQLRIGGPGFRNFEAFEPGIQAPRNFFLALSNAYYFRPAVFNLEYGLLALGLPFIRRFTCDEFPFTDTYYSLNLFTLKF